MLTHAEAKVFTQLVKLAFSQRRKMMLKLLKTRWPEDQLQSAFTEIGIPAMARGETIDLLRYVALTRYLMRA